MLNTTERKTEITEELKNHEKHVKSLLEKFNPDYTVNAYKSYNEYGFNIQHKTRNWNHFVTVKIDAKNKANFSHSTGGWREGVSPEDIMESTLECFHIAKEIMDMKEEVGEIVRSMGKLQFELDNILERELNEERKKANEDCLAELDNKYEKITAEEVIEKLQTQASIKLIKPSHYNKDEKTTERQIFTVANYGFDTNSKMNLYILSQNKDSWGREYTDKYKISKNGLQDHMTDAHVFIEEVEEAN